MTKKDAQNELYGYTGKLLRIDLSSGTSRVEELDPEKLRAYIGGIGIGVVRGGAGARSARWARDVTNPAPLAHPPIPLSSPREMRARLANDPRPTKCWRCRRSRGEWCRLGLREVPSWESM